MEQKILILGFTSYNFKDDNGVVRKGCKVTYLTENKLQEDSKFGYLPIVQNLDLSWFDKLTSTGVGFYNAKFGIVSQGSRAKLELTDLEFINPFLINELF